MRLLSVGQNNYWFPIYIVTLDEVFSVKLHRAKFQVSMPIIARITAITPRSLPKPRLHFPKGTTDFYRNMASGTPSETSKVQASAEADAGSFDLHNIRNTSINEGPGVHLSQSQKLLVGSVLDVSVTLCA
jgi:hypothetical protein